MILSSEGRYSWHQALGIQPPLNAMSRHLPHPPSAVHRPPLHQRSLSRPLRLLIGISLLICLLVRLELIFTVPFTDTTEARYAEIARKMVETNDWITPQFDYGVPFWGKPPLHTWLSALGMKTIGVHEYAARLPIFALSLLLLAISHRFIRRLRGPDTALITTLILFTNGLFFIASATVMTDLVMSFGIALSFLSFARLQFTPGASRASAYLFFVGIAIGLLAKGPVAAVLTLLPVALWCLLQGQILTLWRQLPWIKGSLLLAALALPWFLIAELKTPGFLNYFILGEHLERFIDSGWKGDLYGSGHAHAKGSILLYALLTMLPWTPFLLYPLIRRWRLPHTRNPHELFCLSCQSRKARYALTRLREDDRPWLSYLVCWSLTPLLFFTLASNILPTYVLPATLPLSMLAAELWASNIHARRQSRASHSRWLASSTIAATALPLVLLVALKLDPYLLAHRTQKFLVSDLQHHQATHPPSLVYWKKRYYSAEFYTRGQCRHIETDQQLHQLLQNQQTDFLVVRNKHLHKLKPILSRHFHLIARYQKHELYQENTPKADNHSPLTQHASHP